MNSLHRTLCDFSVSRIGNRGLPDLSMCLRRAIFEFTYLAFQAEKGAQDKELSKQILKRFADVLISVIQVQDLFDYEALECAIEERLKEIENASKGEVA